MLLGGCTKAPAPVVIVSAPREYRGQVFIATQSGVSVKLGLARVYFLSDGQVKKLQQAAAGAVATVELFTKEEEKKAMGHVASLQSSIAAERAEIEDNTRRRTELKELNNHAAEANIRIENLHTQIKFELEHFEDVKRKAALVTEGIWRELCKDEPAIFTTLKRTDADGFFNYNEPAKDERMAVLIQATRQVGAEMEDEVWFMWIEKLKDDRGLVLFSNHNQLGMMDPAEVRMR